LHGTCLIPAESPPMESSCCIQCYAYWNGASVASVTSNGVDGQLTPLLNVRKPTSGKHHQARLAPSRAEVKASEPSVITAMEKVKEKERNSKILEKL